MILWIIAEINAEISAININRNVIAFHFLINYYLIFYVLFINYLLYLFKIELNGFHFDWFNIFDKLTE